MSKEEPIRLHIQGHISVVCIYLYIRSLWLGGLQAVNSPQNVLLLGSYNARKKSWVCANTKHFRGYA